MQICQNPNCSNPFNPDGNRFCISCGQSSFGKLLRNRYRVLILLGEGGFSRTYAAEDADRLNAPCVIKQFFPQVQGTVQRAKAAEFFREEAFRLYELGENHTQIPRLLAYFEQGLSLYLVQEFIQGKTLLQEVKQQPFSEAQIRQLLADLLPVLEFVHSHNVIHRDIKPENIIRRDTDGKPVLIDFGGAKQVTQTSLARQATVIYTIGYAPAEQMAGFACNGSDLYALGVTCARLLTQCLPSQDSFGSINDGLYDAMNGKWLWQEYLQNKGITIGDDLGKILDKLLKNLPSERYQSAAAVFNDLMSIKTSTTETQIIETAQTTLLQLQTPPKSNLPLPPLQTFEFEVLTVDTVGTEVSRDRSCAKFFAEELSHSVNIEMVAIPGGTFMMGSPTVEGDADERPQHQVTIEPFLIGKFPVTQAQWRVVAALPKVKQTLNPHPSKFKGVNRPVENVSWHEAVEFCVRLSQKTGRKYRLPSEAEWEYACRAGTTTSFHFGETITPDLVTCSSSDTYSVDTKTRYRKETTDVGSFLVANAFGLYDMHGLVWEWCADAWHNNYHGAPADGSVWEVGGDVHRRVLRGGSWSFSAELCRSASRSWNESDGGLRVCGFRVVLSAT
ncbi:bifunctional serine/threonine-protein kinase/formylglycine-generating enzyme family protein [Halotia branconii]|uniref:Bifunctional serine/threonine-protein kinase/formylglycine-generating enzyme family protein n=1 Tax=Halotia branconii CENA392 TaxID=1539056 RepID=A0AAJ6P718_9CYAN|nr:bifunctional serine/threonine-protein kinase/formylglycine-generating enzyme family protein [Halotia branconii]WGV23156.1 bifunctional serine/threonine-protein kinase/formylglycine-generating enzyme family protein [Halotia branconii CENA392]